MISYLDNFASRMEHISEIASVLCRRNRNLAIEASFGDNELDNIIFAVPVHIIERSLTTSVRCTLEDIEDFLADFFKDYNREISESELRELTRYIVKDILQNKGESFKFKIMDHSDFTIKSYSVRLIRDIEDDDGVIYYVLEKQGFDMLFRTKEVDDLGFQLEEIRLQKLIERGNFSDASAQSKLLDDSIKVLSSQLQQIENDKNHIIIHMEKHAEFLYEQVKSIADHAYIKINGKNKRIMQISIPDKLDRGYQDRVSNVIDDTLIRQRKSFESEEIKGDDLLRQVNSYFSDRLLFNAITGSNSVEIKVWKSLEDERNSRLERWESRYSGGEHFLVYFVVYTALVSYARRRQTIDDNDEVRSVFLIDNPFGETSSAHLLDVFIKIVNKFKLQTICFSALKQDSITKNFDLIYQLKLRKAEYSNRSYLEINKEINNAGAEPDRQLDFVSMNRQLSFV